jgi:hypothetical protein
MDPVFRWMRHSVYGGGGKKLPHPILCGMIEVTIDGGLRIEPEDDYYSGEMSSDEARRLATAILNALDAKVAP